MATTSWTLTLTWDDDSARGSVRVTQSHWRRSEVVFQRSSDAWGVRCAVMKAIDELLTRSNLEGMFPMADELFD